MLGKFIAFAVAACIFAVIAVPSSNKDDSGPQGVNGVVSDKPSSEVTDQSSSDWFAGVHTLNRQSDGHFYATASVDGVSMNMLVDTGASVIALTADDASAAGIQWSESDVRVIGSGASGAVHGVPIRLREVEVGGMVHRDIDAVIVPEGLAISLLGQSFLSQIGNVEISGDEMVMGGG